jgi:hypothetical protein
MADAVFLSNIGFREKSKIKQFFSAVFESYIINMKAGINKNRCIQA